MFSDKLQEYAQKKYEQRLPVLGKIGEVVAGKLPLCTKEEQILMKFFYGTMPLRDAGEYEFEVFLGFVRHSLMVYRTMEWCREVPEEIFLHHILYYRINSENIEDCRKFFYEKLIDRIKGKTLQEAVLEINYWCAENGSYEASDHRTISPLVLYRSGKGRCGEESTFAVTAFRSVGVPARQVYAPWWAHCDDNHAWVEVYIEGKWHFLGACEPEEILDRGWFVNASSRALLIHTRNFSDYGDDLGEPCVGREDRIWFYNVTAGYAKARQFEIRVLEEDGRAVGQADVFVEVLNSGEYHSVAKLCTNEEGKASILIGLGSIHLRIVKGKKGREVTVNTRVQESAAVVIREDWFAEGQGEWTQLDLEAPEDSPIHRTLMSKEQKDRSLRKLCRANEIRSGRIEGYYVEEKAARYPEEKEILHAAAGNFDEIYSFLDKDSNVDRRYLLHSLTVKDYKDAKAAILEKHLGHASKYRERWEKAGKLDIYISYILCPRIYLEEMTYYREFIEKYFGGQAWLSDPFAIWGYIERTIGYDSAEDYGTIFTTPVGTLSLRFGNLVSRRILFVAICRTFGIPARISPVNM
ncbi:transglutaminase domain-containing protein [Roseburia hominis]